MEQLTPFAALIGIDWSDAKHDICLVETATGTQELSVVKHTPESLNEWARALRSRFGGERIAVCLEQSRGSLIYALLKYDFLTLYPINPQMLSRFREAFTPSRAKDDPTDAEYLVSVAHPSSGASEGAPAQRLSRRASDRGTPARLRDGRRHAARTTRHVAHTRRVDPDGRRQGKEARLMPRRKNKPEPAN